MFCDVCFNFVLPIIFSFIIFKEGSLEEFPLVYVWLGCVFINQQKSVNISLASVQYQTNYKQHKYDMIESYSVEHKNKTTQGLVGVKKLN